MSKTSFLLHDDSLIILDKMTNEQAGIFIKSIYYYRKNNNLPELDFGMEMAITPFINQFNRDKEKWNVIAERNKNNGLKGGRPKLNDAIPKNPDGYLKTQDNPIEPKKAVNVNVSVNDNVNVSVNEKIKEDLFADYDFNDNEKNIIQEWLQYKKEKKEIYKPTGLKSLITTINKNKNNGCNIIEAITISMAGNWQGIVYEKGYCNSKSKEDFILSTKDRFKYIDELYINVGDHMDGCLCGYDDSYQYEELQKHKLFCLTTKQESIDVCKELGIDYNALQRIDYGLWHDMYDNMPEMLQRCFK